jgi:hypothetical protein
MKKLLLIFLCLPIIGFGQITVTDSNLPNIGDTVITGYDFGTFTIGNAGPNQFWDFSTLAGTPSMLLGFIDQALTPFQSSFPTSNICVEVDSSVYYYLNRSTNGLTTVGFVDLGMVFPYNKMLLPTPLNYQDTIIDNSILYQWDTVFSPPLPSFIWGIPGPYIIDSVSNIYGNITEYIVDAWGQVQMSNGTYDALRVFESIYEFDSVLFRIIDTTNGLSMWIADSSSGGIYWSESKYSWRTNDSTITWSLVDMYTDSAGIPYGGVDYFMGNSISSIVISPPFLKIDWKKDVSCNGYCDGMIVLDVFGTAWPFTFSWTGPNGYTSNNSDIYNLCPGTYIVIVTDTNGNTSNDTAIISEPVALTVSINQMGIDLTVNTNGGISPYNYLWNTFDTLQSITPLANGLYWCIVEDKSGCTDTAYFNVTNIGTSINEFNNDSRKVLRIIDVLGRESEAIKNTLLYFIYDDGTMEKKIIIE